MGDAKEHLEATAQEQGWTERTMIVMATNFIDHIGMADSFREYLAREADVVNE